MIEILVGYYLLGSISGSPSVQILETLLRRMNESNTLSSFIHRIKGNKKPDLILEALNEVEKEEKKLGGLDGSILLKSLSSSRFDEFKEAIQGSQVNLMVNVEDFISKRDDFITTFFTTDHGAARRDLFRKFVSIYMNLVISSYKTSPEILHSIQIEIQLEVLRQLKNVTEDSVDVKKILEELSNSLSSLISIFNSDHPPTKLIPTDLSKNLPDLDKWDISGEDYLARIVKKLAESYPNHSNVFRSIVESINGDKIEILPLDNESHLHDFHQGLQFLIDQFEIEEIKKWGGTLLEKRDFQQLTDINPTSYGSGNRFVSTELENERLNKLLEQKRFKLLITANMGCGKTYLLRRIEKELNLNETCIPILIELRYIRNPINNMNYLIRKRFIEVFEALNDNRLATRQKWIDSRLKKRDYVLLLDGWDEHPEPFPKAELTLDHPLGLLLNQSNVNLIITARSWLPKIELFSRPDLGRKFINSMNRRIDPILWLELQPFNWTQVKEFARHYFDSLDRGRVKLSLDDYLNSYQEIFDGTEEYGVPLFILGSFFSWMRTGVIVQSKIQLLKEIFRSVVLRHILRPNVLTLADLINYERSINDFDDFLTFTEARLMQIASLVIRNLEVDISTLQEIPQSFVSQWNLMTKSHDFVGVLRGNSFRFFNNRWLDHFGSLVLLDEFCGREDVKVLSSYIFANTMNMDRIYEYWRSILFDWGNQKQCDKNIVEEYISRCLKVSLPHFWNLGNQIQNDNSINAWNLVISGKMVFQTRTNKILGIKIEGDVGGKRLKISESTIELLVQLSELERITLDHCNLDGGLFPHVFKKIPKLSFLSLNTNEISKLTECLEEMRNLTYLDLGSNLIISLPENIHFPPNLEYLDLRNNKLASLPKTILNLTCLQELNLNDNRLESLPVGFNDLTKLKKLHLDFNNLNVFSEMFYFPAMLNELSLIGNEISNIPENLMDLIELRILKIGSNRITSLPESIGKLITLEVLWLDTNNLRTTPESFWNLTNLKELNLHKNQLTNISEGLGNFINLQVLWLSENQISYLPEELGELSNLLWLDLMDNRLESIPSSIVKLTNLRLLDLSFNRLKHLPQFVKELQEMGCLVHFND